MSDTNFQLISDHRSCSLSTEQVLCANSLRCSSINVFQINLNWVCRIRLRISFESSDGPRSIDHLSVLLEICNENALNHSLVKKGGERVSRIDKARARSPCARPVDSVLCCCWVPECDLVDLRWLMRHDGWLQTHVLQQVKGAWLDAICATSFRWLRSVVDVLDLITPSCQAGGQKKSHWSCADNDNVVLLNGRDHVGGLCDAVYVMSAAW